MTAYLLLTRAAPMRLHRRRACGCVHTLLAALGACTHPHTQRLQGRTFLVRQRRLTPKHYPDGGVPSAHSRRTYAASPPSCVWMRAHSPRCARRVHASTHATAPRSNLSCAATPPNPETLPRWWRTFCSLAPHLCGFTAVVRVDACTLSSLRSARARIHTRNGSKVEPFLCGKAAYMRKILYICSMVKNLLTFCRAFLVFLVDNKHCLWCIIHKKKWW